MCMICCVVESLDELIAETQAALDAARADRDERRAAEDLAIQALEEELRGLVLARARRSQSDEDDHHEAAAGAGGYIMVRGVIDEVRLRNMHRPDAIVLALRQLAHPAGPAEITAY